MASAMVAGACTGRAGNPSGGRRSVVAAFYPVFEAARMIGGARVAVTNLTPPGVEPHDLELSPRDLDRILDSDVLLYLGHGFQPAVQDAASRRDGGVTVDVLAALEPNLRAPASPSGGEETDPHVWLDPVLFADVAEAVRDALARADPGGRAVYDRNAQAYAADLRALDGRYSDGLATCARRVIVTSHAAFGYLSERYGLRQEAVTGLSPEAEPDPRRLAELIDLVKREGVTTIFTEALVSPRVADTLAREAGVRTAVLDPIEGLTKAEVDRGDGYVSVMDRNLATLREALGCA